MKKYQIVDISECKEGRMYKIWGTNFSPFLFISKEIVDNGVYYTLLSKRGVEKILFSTTTKIWVQEYE